MVYFNSLKLPKMALAWFQPSKNADRVGINPFLKMIFSGDMLFCVLKHDDLMRLT
jgi:hypothetical protein